MYKVSAVGVNMMKMLSESVKHLCTRCQTKWNK